MQRNLAQPDALVIGEAARVRDRAVRLPLDRHLHRERRLDECCIGKPKQFRRVATRCEQTARDYLAIDTIFWIR